MPTNKRRSRHGNNPSGSQILKPSPAALTANNLKTAVALATILPNGNGTPLTLKEQQQLDRNAYLSTLTKDQLKVECRKRGQKNTGTKAELVQQSFLLLEFVDEFLIDFWLFSMIFRYCSLTLVFFLYFRRATI